MLMYLHLRPSARQDQPVDDLDDDILMEIDAPSTHVPHIDQDSMDETILNTYRDLGLA